MPYYFSHYIQLMYLMHRIFFPSDPPPPHTHTIYATPPPTHIHTPPSIPTLPPPTHHYHPFTSTPTHQPTHPHTPTNPSTQTPAPTHTQTEIFTHIQKAKRTGGWPCCSPQPGQWRQPDKPAASPPAALRTKLHTPPSGQTAALPLPETKTPGLRCTQ